MHRIRRLFFRAKGSRNSWILTGIPRLRNPSADADPATNLLVFRDMNEPGEALHFERAFIGRF